jgi:hypothetical protein
MKVPAVRLFLGSPLIYPRQQMSADIANSGVVGVSIKLVLLERNSRIGATYLDDFANCACIAPLSLAEFNS